MTASDDKTDTFNRTGEANVKDWGAVGDGETDDTKAFEAAVEHVANAPAGTISLLQASVRYKFQKIYVWCSI